MTQKTHLIRGARESSKHQIKGPGADGLYRYRGASIELSSLGTRRWWATVRFRNQEKDFEATSSDEAIEKAREWIDAAPELSHETHESRRVADFNTLPELIRHSRAEGATHTAGHGPETRIYFPRGDGQYEEATVWKKESYWHAQGPGSRQLVRKPPRDARPIPAHAPRHAAAEASSRREIEHELWLCQDCMIAEVNGDLSSLDDERAEEVQQGIEQLVERVGPLSSNFSEGEGELEFSRMRCDACGTTLAGGRYRFASFGKEHTTRESAVVRDYIAVDRNDRRVAGPFRSQGEASQHVPPGGHVKFSSAQNRRPPPAPSSYPIFRASKKTDRRGQRRR